MDNNNQPSILDQNNNQLAVPPRRSMQLATIIPASHWISIGYSQAQATAMEELQNDIDNYYDVDGGETDITLQEKGSLIIIDEILLHHELLLPRWDKFANGLRGRDSVTRVRLRGISLPPPVLDIVFPALQSMNSLIHLTLYRNDLGNEGYQRLSSFLEGNTRLEKLAIVQNVIDDLSAARVFSLAVKNHAALKQLVLCRLNNISILGELLEGCGGIEALGIIRDGFGSEGVNLLANFIRNNKNIEELRFDGNKITDSDVEILLAAISKQSTNLKRLNLKDNDITLKGDINLLKVMFDPTSMDSIINSNHSCRVYTDTKNRSIVAQRPPLEQEVLNINEGKYTIGQKIRKKVVLALCGVDGGVFDLSHFNDLPLGVMPRVLELIQEHTTVRRNKNSPEQLEKDALSRLFHTLRGWELPILFENLNPNKGVS